MMRDTVFLAFNDEKVTGMTKTGANTLEGGEYEIKIEVEVPESFFEKAVPEARLVVDEDAMARKGVEMDVTEFELEEDDGDEAN